MNARRKGRVQDGPYRASRYDPLSTQIAAIWLSARDR
jgi:hypothetical protein